MKRILTLALLASAMSLPAMAESGLTGSSSTGLSTGASIGGTHVGAAVGAETNNSGLATGVHNNNAGLSSNTRAETSTDTSNSNTNSDTSMNSGSSVNSDTSMSGSSNSSSDNATGDTSIGGSARGSASASSPAISGESLASSDVKLIQQALRQEGFYSGTADGVWGARTASALQQFQQRNQIGATGSLNSQTLDKLGVNLQATSASRINTSAGSSAQ